MSFDAGAHRESSLESWEAAAPGWARRQALLRELGDPVSHWMLDAVCPQPGERVLELAAGLGETAMLAAEMVAPMGGVVISDQAEAMLAAARERAGELGLTNIEFQVLNAEWIDLPLATIDVVLCRWGYMLMADPAAALAETRRVLRPGGRLAAAVWDQLSLNPWAALPGLELRERGLAPAAPAGEWSPGPFALAESGRIEQLLAEAGFTGIVVSSLELSRRHPDFEDLWEATLDLSPSFHNAALSQTPAELAAIRSSLAERFASYTSPTGAIEIPGRTLVVSAGA